MDFPTSEPEIKRLCDKMLDGYNWHAPDFPKVKRVTLSSKRLSYVAVRKALLEARAKERIATKAKNKKLSELVKIMQNALRKSEVDVAACPEKLKLIGWSAKAPPQPTPIPGQPLNLRIIAKESTNIKLQWERPADNSRVRNYLIERRRQDGGSGDFQPAGISYQTQIGLTGQPVEVPLDYRVRASNSSGSSLPSNTISLILP